MASTLDNIEEDLMFYDELKLYAFGQSNQLSEQRDKFLILNGCMQIESVLELAISIVGNLPRKSTVSMDFADGSDAKKVTSVFRNNNIAKGKWMNSYKIHNIGAKRGKLRIMGYNRFKKCFDYYVIPYSSYNHLTSNYLEITLDTFSGYYSTPVPTGRSCYCHWDMYRCKDFTDMATK